MWPEGTNYLDKFIIGLPHLNYYEGSGTIHGVRWLCCLVGSTSANSANMFFLTVGYEGCKWGG